MNTIFYDVFAVPIEAMLSIPWIGRGLTKLAKKPAGRTRPKFLVPVLASAVLLLAFLVPLRSAWLPRAAIGAAVAALLALAVLDPERFIADRNIDRIAQGKTLDTGYLATFSADVVPAADRLPEPLRSCVLGPVVRRISEDDWREWNLSRSLARQSFVATVDRARCPSPARR